MSLLSPQLLAFVAVAAHKTVHAAADSLNLTQTAVTQRIRSLERLLKTTLFQRTRRGMLLTKEGEALLRYTQAAKNLEGEALAAIQGAGRESEIELTLSADSSIMQSRVIPNCLQLVKKFPKLLFHFDVCDTEDKHLKLRSAQCDFAIIREEHLSAEMKFKRLKPEQYVLVASEKWKNRPLEEIVSKERIIDFNQQDYMTFDYLKKFNLFELALHGRYFVNQTESLAKLVVAGVGYTTLAKEFAESYVKDKQLIILNENKTLDISQALAWFDRPEPPEYFREIIHLF